MDIGLAMRIKVGVESKSSCGFCDLLCLAAHSANVAESWDVDPTHT